MVYLHTRAHARAAALFFYTHTWLIWWQLDSQLFFSETYLQIYLPYGAFSLRTFRTTAERQARTHTGGLDGRGVCARSSWRSPNFLTTVIEEDEEVLNGTSKTRSNLVAQPPILHPLLRRPEMCIICSPTANTTWRGRALTETGRTCCSEVGPGRDINLLLTSNLLLIYSFPKQRAR